jgi:hypothetical protein
MIKIFGAHGMRMYLNATKVDDPRKASRVIDNDFFRSASRRERERYRSQPRGALRWCALLIERLTFGAIDVSLEDKRTFPDSGERARRNRQVVADHVKFRELCLLREIQLPWVSNTDLASVDREQLGSVLLPHKLSLHDWRNLAGLVQTFVTHQSEAQ